MYLISNRVSENECVGSTIIFLPFNNIEPDRAGLDPGHADHDEEGRAEEVHDPRRLEEEVDARRHCEMDVKSQMMQLT